MNETITNILKVEMDSLLPRNFCVIRKDTVEDAISWPEGPNIDDQSFTEYWSNDDGYSIRFGKPGKETVRTGARRNKNDMLPAVFLNEEQLIDPATFGDIYEAYAQIRTNREKITLLISLFFRCAYMMDHKKNDDDVYRYIPDDEITNYLLDSIPQIHNIPSDVFLHYIDAIALNEDVKYYTLGKIENFKEGTGRINNLMTQIYVMSVMIEKISIGELAAEFSRHGVSPLSKRKVLELYPALKPLTE